MISQYEGSGITPEHRPRREWPSREQREVFEAVIEGGLGSENLDEIKFAIVEASGTISF
jgi:hypothetical protein